MKKILLFDFDGVIHDTFEFHRNNLSAFINKELSVEQFKRIFDGNIFKGMPHEIKELNLSDYLKIIKNDHNKLKVDTEIKAVLNNLSKNYKLSIVSSGSEVLISLYLETNNLSNLFDYVYGMETHRSKVEKFKILFAKYDLPTSDFLFITDTLGDILEANEVGLETFALDSGYHDRERIVKGNPLQIISQVSEISPLLNSLSDKNAPI